MQTSLTATPVVAFGVTGPQLSVAVAGESTILAEQVGNGGLFVAKMVMLAGQEMVGGVVSGGPTTTVVVQTVQGESNIPGDWGM